MDCFDDGKVCNGDCFVKKDCQYGKGEKNVRDKCIHTKGMIEGTDHCREMECVCFKEAGEPCDSEEHEEY
jgi:hypothetical protein